MTNEVCKACDGKTWTRKTVNDDGSTTFALCKCSGLDFDALYSFLLEEGEQGVEVKEEIKH